MKTSKSRKKKKTNESHKQKRNLDIRQAVLQVVIDKFTGLEGEYLSENDWGSFDLEKNPSKQSNSSNFHSFRLNINSKDNPSSIQPSKGLATNDNTAEEQNIEALQPFDSSKIRVSYKEFPIDLVLERIRRGELKLNPEFQRAPGIWNQEAQSRLIESLLIRIPIPVFYLDCSEEDEWIVVDGLQRLNTFKDFALDKTLRLKGLEFLTALHGKTFDELPRSLQRRILESTLGLYLIEKGTPDRVKWSIFQRINTGGMPLSHQEIRHALHQGSATILLNSLVQTEEFKRATDGSISDERMADRECVLRCLAFMLTSYSDYNRRDMDGFLNEAMETLHKSPEKSLDNLKSRFIRSMHYCHLIFGREAFRKTIKGQHDRNPINRSLFEVWAVTLDSLKDFEVEKLLLKRNLLKTEFKNILETNAEFFASITDGTGEIRKVQKRFLTIEQLVKGVLNDKVNRS